MVVSRSIFIATLGSEPQVVTAALDLLMGKGEQINQVVVVHTTAPGTPVGAAVEALRQVANAYPAPFDFQGITSEGLPLADVDSPAAGAAVFGALYSRIRGGKQMGLKVHLCIAGGRKTMALFGMAAAQLLFDDGDQLWHLFSSGEFLASKRLHPAPGDDVALVPIPVILWTRVSPAFDRLFQFEDPFAALHEVEALQIKEKFDACRAFVLGSLTRSEERVVRLLVLHGLSDQAIGEQLCLSPRTVEQHLRSAYTKAGEHWELDNLTRSNLISLLNLYYSVEIRGKPA